MPTATRLRRRARVDAPPLGVLKRSQIFVAYLLTSAIILQVTSELNGWTPLHLAAINSRCEVADASRAAHQRKSSIRGVISRSILSRGQREGQLISRKQWPNSKLRKLLQPFIAKKGEAGDGEGGEDMVMRAVQVAKLTTKKEQPLGRDLGKGRTKGSSEDFGE